MSKWKAFGVFFTLLFFSSVRGSLFFYFSTSDTVQRNRIVWLIASIIINLVLLYFAIRFWRKAFRADNNRPD